MTFYFPTIPNDPDQLIGDIDSADEAIHIRNWLHVNWAEIRLMAASQTNLEYPPQVATTNKVLLHCDTCHQQFEGDEWDRTCPTCLLKSLTDIIGK
jgi:rubrerythrin